jgi:hypothetical protein
MDCGYCSQQLHAALKKRQPSQVIARSQRSSQRSPRARVDCRRKGGRGQRSGASQAKALACLLAILVLQIAACPTHGNVPIQGGRCSGCGLRFGSNLECREICGHHYMGGVVPSYTRRNEPLRRSEKSAEPKASAHCPSSGPSPSPDFRAFQGNSGFDLDLFTFLLVFLVRIDEKVNFCTFLLF